MNEQLSLLLGLGPNAEWPYTEKSLIEVINLQKEKEITKQHYYKLENTNKSIELLTHCLQASIPGYLLPIIFSGESLNEELLQRLIQSQHEQQQRINIVNTTPQYTRPNERQLYANYHQQQQQQQQKHQQQHQPQHQSPSNLGPPVSFHRPLSPAKIGAAAVAQLDRQRYPTSPVHRRNQSLPVTSSAVPSISVHSPAYGLRQSTMMGTMNSIQFINENPGKLKRRRSSLEEQKESSNEDENGIEEEDEEPEKEKKKFVKGHQRTRSDNSLIGERRKSSTPEIRSPLKNNNQDLKNKENEKDLKAVTPSLGPRFANSILSPPS